MVSKCLAFVDALPNVLDGIVEISFCREKVRIGFQNVGSHLSIGVLEMVKHLDGGNIGHSEIEVLEEL